MIEQPTCPTPDLSEATQRLRALLGEERLRTLESAHVVVVGVGGVGGACAEALVRSHVGHITVIDGDTVEASNLNRQAVAFVDTIGMRKTDAFIRLAHNINPDCDVEVRDVFLTPENTAQVLDSIVQADYTIDAIDSISQKIEVARWAQAHNVPIVSSMGGAKKCNPCALGFADIYETSICPMARAVRKLCRKNDIEHLEVLYSREPAQPQSDTSQPVLGTMSYLPAIMGEMLAGYVICKLIGIAWQHV